MLNDEDCTVANSICNTALLVWAGPTLIQDSVKTTEIFLTGLLASLS